MTNMDQEQRDTVGHAAPTAEQTMVAETSPTAITANQTPPSPPQSSPTSQQITITSNTHQTTTTPMPSPSPVSISNALSTIALMEPARVSKAPTEKIKLVEVNSYLTCSLCKGYLIDATTISECLHSFCRSCIIKFLQDHSHCPECEVVINKTKPNLKLDKTLQDIVYKLVPDLFLKEMARRQQFYASHPSKPMPHLSPEQRGEDTERIVFNARDKFSLCLEYISEESIDVTSIINNNSIFANHSELDKEKDSKENNMKRYLQCPGLCRIDILKKFVRNKYNVDTINYHIDILYKRIPLPDHYTLIDIAYIYSWKRNAPMQFFFRITNIHQVRDRFDYYEASERPVSPSPTTPSPGPPAVAASVPNEDSTSADPKVVLLYQFPAENKVKSAIPKKPKTVRFHSDVVKANPVATSTLAKTKIDKTDKPVKHDRKSELNSSDKIEKLINGDKYDAFTMVDKFFMPANITKDTKDVIDVNSDEWLKKQVKRAAKEQKKSKGREVKNAIKDLQESIKDMHAALKDISAGSDRKLMHKVMLGGGSKKVSAVAAATTKKLSVANTSKECKDRSRETSPKMIDIDTLRRQEANLAAPIILAETNQEQFMSMLNLKVKLAVDPSKTPSHGHKRKAITPNSAITAKGSKKQHLAKVPKTPKTPKTPKLKTPKPKQPKVIHPYLLPAIPTGMSMSMTTLPTLSPLLTQQIPKPSPKALPKPKEMSAERKVNLEEPNLKNLLNTCKIPSSLSITCVDGGTTDRENQIKPVINHIEILKLPEVREVHSPDSSTKDAREDTRSSSATSTASTKSSSSSLSKEKLEKVGTTMKLQSKEESLKKEEEVKRDQELSITITVEKDAKDESKPSSSTSTNSPPGKSGGHPGMGVHLNLPKILQATPSGRSINGIPNNSFQRMFEETVKKRNDALPTSSKNDEPRLQAPRPPEEKNGTKRNILDIATELYSKKSKLVKICPKPSEFTPNAAKVAIPRLKKGGEPCDTLSNLHSNKLAMNYSVSINQSPKSPKSPPNDNHVTSTTSNKLEVAPKPRDMVIPSPKITVKPGKSINTPSPKCSVPLPIQNLIPKIPKTSPKVGIPMPALSPLSSNSASCSPKPSSSSPREKAAGLITPSATSQPKLDANQLQEKYKLQNLAQLSASFNFNPAAALGHQQVPHQAMAAIQQAMLMNFGMQQQHQQQQQQQQRPWFNMPPANMVQYEKFLQNLRAAQPPGVESLLTKKN